MKLAKMKAMDASILKSIQQLSVSERIQLVQDIWDSIASAPEALELTDRQRQELDARLDAHTRNPEACSTWAEVRARLE